MRGGGGGGGRGGNGCGQCKAVQVTSTNRDAHNPTANGDTELFYLEVIVLGALDSGIGREDVDNESGDADHSRSDQRHGNPFTVRLVLFKVGHSMEDDWKHDDGENDHNWNKQSLCTGCLQNQLNLDKQGEEKREKGGEEEKRGECGKRGKEEKKGERG